MGETVEVAIGIVRHEGCILVTRRPRGAHLERLWEFPGGKLLPGEDPEACVRREVEEETGLVVEVDRLVEEFRFPYPGRVVHLRFYDCRVMGGTLDPLLQEGRWCPLEDLGSLTMPEANAPVISRLIEEGRKDCKKGEEL